MPHSPAPPIEGELLPHGIHHLVQHNSNTSYPQEHYDDGMHLQSHYGSPAPQLEDGYYQQQRYGQYQYQDRDMGQQYDTYNNPIYPDHYSTPATSPPTPSMSSRDMRTRSGLSVRRSPQNLRPMPESRSRVTKSPKPKKAKAVKVKAEKKIAKLEKPLSELTKDWDHLPIVDIGAYVNRSAEERRREVETGKVPGKVKRPMNSFMLYRKAYQGRTKDWCLQNNHQIVSQVCGDSWPLEPDHIKDQYSEWARIERQNHQNAHPGYKFSPTKPGTAKNSKRKVSEEPMTEESDLEDFEWHGTSKRGTKKHRPSPRMVPQLVAYPTTESAYRYDTRDNSMEPSHNFHPSSYQANNIGRPPPPPYDQMRLRYGEYYQSRVQSHQNMRGVIEDVTFRKTTTPTPAPNAYVGLPGGHGAELLGDTFPQFSPSPAPEQRIDPNLVMPFDPASYIDHGVPSHHYAGSQNEDHQWQAPFDAHDHNAMPYIDPSLSQNGSGSQIHDPHAHMLRGAQDGWHAGSLDEDDQFNKWMDGN